jgi:hypothetical protein
MLDPWFITPRPSARRPMHLPRLRSRSLRPYVLLAAALLASAARPAAAQIEGGLDGTMESDYVWRGITRASSAVYQPAAWIGYLLGANEVTGGVWSALEPGRVDDTELTLAGRDGGAMGEWDAWAQYTRHLPGISVAVGAIAYRFRGDAASGGLNAAANTAEIYAQLAPTALPWLEPRATLYHDVRRTHGTYLEVDASHSFSIIPLLPTSILLGATGGFSLRQPDVSASGGRFESFAATGATHADLRGGVMFRPGRERFAFRALLHHQRSFDDATRPVGTLRAPRSRWWTEVGASYAVAPERKPR